MRCNKPSLPQVALVIMFYHSQRTPKTPSEPSQFYLPSYPVSFVYFLSPKSLLLLSRKNCFKLRNLLHQVVSSAQVEHAVSLLCEGDLLVLHTGRL